MKELIMKMNNPEIAAAVIARESAGILKETRPERKVEFEIEEGVIVHGDPALLQMVVQNLLENAWKYSARKESALIRFGSTRCGNELICHVKDNGIGFDMADADQIFGLFNRLHSNADYEGTGIGLATVQRIVHRHNGRVWAEGCKDEGAAFYFSIPQN